MTKQTKAHKNKKDKSRIAGFTFTILILGALAESVRYFAYIINSGISVKGIIFYTILTLIIVDYLSKLFRSFENEFGFGEWIIKLIRNKLRKKQ